MTLRFHFHPLASFCHKALIALYEKEIPFEPVLIDFGDPDSAAAFRTLWPMAKMPVLEDTARGQLVAETSAVVEYLDRHYPGKIRFVSEDADLVWQIRMWDSVFDSYVHEPMQKIVTDNLRPTGRNDLEGVEQAKAQLRQSYDFLEKSFAGRTWIVRDTFTLADCSAAPALFYADTVVPFAPEHVWLADYLERLMARPAYARVLKEAEPYFKNVPVENKPIISGRAAERERRRPK
ncbi:MAG TPA: glutathione S-transferase family protein [Rhizobiaceae bacterium]|nr:glutathione S-transferase family protein [Rhizobiaceae bacterium]